MTGVEYIDMGGLLNCRWQKAYVKTGEFFKNGKKGVFFGRGVLGSKFKG
jgi:hypothetical protein